MRKKIFISGFCLLLASFVFAQKIQYGGMQQFGLLIGEKATRFNFTLTNGIRIHRFFVGLGADALFGRRYYFSNHLNCSAFFLDGRYYINKKKNFFCKINGGVNLLTENFPSDDYNKYKKRPGLYSCAGIGFKAKIGKEIFYSFDVNYCYRQSVYDYSYTYYYGWNNQWRTEKYDLRQFAILINMGIEIF